MPQACSRDGGRCETLQQIMQPGGGIVEPVAPEKAQTPLNDHNFRQHELALARQAAGQNKARISRSDAWAKAQATFAEKVRSENPKATEHDGGL